MFAIGTRPDYRLPFTTVVVDQVTFTHAHRDRSGFTWQEAITLNIHLLAIKSKPFDPPTTTTRRPPDHGHRSRPSSHKSAGRTVCLS
jgi:hypothetical protein